MKKLFLIASIAMVITLTGSISYAATSWYLPEGSTQGSFDLWILVTNPNSTTVDIKYTFYTESGAITYTDPDGIASNSRETLSVLWLSQQDGYSGLQNQPISTKVECTNGYPIYVERAMYWDAGGIEWAGGHTARGISDVEGAVIGIGQPSSFPIVINLPGSYKLVSNITQTNTDQHAITITTSDVTLDLNGFTIDGPGSGGINGIHVNSLSYGGTIYNIEIKNGTVKDFSSGIIVNDVGGIKLSDLKCYNNLVYGIGLGDTDVALIKDTGCNLNGFSGISINTESSGGLLYHNICVGNISSGIECNGNAYYIHDNVSFGNAYGLRISGGSENSVENNLFVDNSTEDIGLNGNNNVVINNTIEDTLIDNGTGNIKSNATNTNLDI